MNFSGFGDWDSAKWDWTCPPVKTRKWSCRWQTRVMQKHAKNCSNSTWKQVANKLTTSF